MNDMERIYYIPKYKPNSEKSLIFIHHLSKKKLHCQTNHNLLYM